MKAFIALASLSLLIPALAAAQGAQPKPVSKKSSTTSAKSSAAAAKAAPAAKPAVDPTPKVIYTDLTIGEIVAEDANRWSDKMASRASVGGFVTQINKIDDGDTEIRICENPKIDPMDRARCIVAKCIPHLPCDLPQIGKPITVKGITRYDAKIGNHWWEIQPIEQIEK
jgi:cell division septation protein DedD